MNQAAFVLVFLFANAALADVFRLPFDEQWFVAQGGDTLNVNHHMAARPQWFGIDFMKTGGPSNRALVKGEGRQLEDYYSWGQPVLAPTEGEVVSAVDGITDNPIGSTNKDDVAGNHIIIRTLDGAFVFLAHFQKDSLRVKKGEKVKAGTVLGKCGNSGNTSAPHIHMHVQDTPDIQNGNGRNITFNHIRVELSGKIFENVDWPLIRGLFVQHAK